MGVVTVSQSKALDWCGRIKGVGVEVELYDMDSCSFTWGNAIK